MNKYFLPYDIYERHKKVGSLISDGERVLDVGGELNQLSKFCKPFEIVVANLKQSQEKSDITIKKSELPFEENSFDVVCAIDVLEHIVQKDRKKFVKSLERVSAKKIILSFPIGTDTHIRYEKKIRDWLESRGQDVTYLEEHILYGLPKKKEINQITDRKKEIFYSGNLSLNEMIFKLHLFDPKVKIIRKLVYLGKLIFNLLTNPVLYAFLSEKEYSEKVVRAYVNIKK